MFCRNCGTKTQEGEKYCKHCAAVVETAGVSGKKEAPALTGTWFQRPKNTVSGRGLEPVENELYNTPASRAPKFYIPNNLTGVSGDKKHRHTPDLHTRVTAKYPAHNKSRVKPDPLFNRSPRLREESRPEQIVLQPPPSVGGKPEINWLTVILPPMISLLLLVLVSLLSGGVSAYMLIMLPVQVISVVVAVINYKKQVAKHSDLSGLRNTKYDQYLSGVTDRILDAARKQLQIANAENPSGEECVDITLRRRKNLWERRPEDADFGCFRVGRGKIPADVTAVWPDRGITLFEDALEQKAADLGNSFRFIDNAPIVVPNNSNIVGIVGDTGAAGDLARQAVVQLSTLHSYEDLKLGLVFPESQRESWAWARWLPHVQDEDCDLRLLASTQTGASVLKEKLLDVLQARMPEEGRLYTTHTEGPRYVLILAAPELFHGNDFFSQLAKVPNAGIRVIYLCRSFAQLPKECGVIVETDGVRGCVYHRDSAASKIRFAQDSMAESRYDVFARAMAPIRLSEAEGKRTIPNSISFLEGYGLNRIEDYDIRRAWERGKASNSFAVPIGIDENGEKFYFDIKDGKHGVHGLIGGMSGSGKSEMLQSWILSMAMNHSPQEIAFVMIDFRGTGLITPFFGLPHLAGAISNINEAKNIRRNKESLEYELKKREVLFDKYGVQNIQGYQQLQKAGVAKEQLPILFVVIDEFAEFKKTFPEFMQWVESSFTKSRAAGIWFILSTQQPTNTASETIKTNTHFKWCLKVNTAAASKEMLGIPDAAQITRPGRSYIKIDNNSCKLLTQVQSFWSGAPYRADRDQSSADQKVAVVDMYGNRVYHTGADGSTGYKSNRTEIEVAVAYIAKYARENHIPAADRIWAESLGERFPLSAVCKQGFDGKTWPDQHDGLRVIIGEVDDPKHQQKYPLVVPFTDCGHIVVYGAPTTGKTTFLQTLIMSAALNYSPEELNVYVMDFGSLSMRVFASMPHLGGIAEMGQDERINKLVRLLRDELEYRKNLFAKAGVGSISAYKAMPEAEKLPYILLVIDNFNVVLPTYPDLDPFFVTLVQSGAGYGIYLAASATGANGFSYKLRDSIHMRYALRLAENSDYSGIVNRTEGLYPENVMGRGLVRGTPPLQFQTALPAEGETDHAVSNNIRMIAQQMKKSWNGRSARKIPQMPETVKYGSIDGDEIYLGLSAMKVEPVVFDYRCQHYLMISGMPGAGKSNLLKALACQMHESVGCTVYALDINGTGLQPLSRIGTYIREASDMDAFFDELMPLLKKRQQTASGSGGFAPILLVIDDFSAFFSAVSEKTVRRVLAIIKLCAGLDVYLLMAGDAGDLATKRMQGEEITMSCVTAKQAVLLGGYINDHGAFRLKLTQAQRNTESGEKEGFFVSKTDVVRMKTMQEKIL